MRALKGHGTENDFVVLPDLDAARELTPQQVRALCNRRAGIGGDGVLRVVRTVHMPGFDDLADRAEFFMDYRNADGSLAEMCGNGIRVFWRYLQRDRLVVEEAAVATRGGIVCVRPDAGGDVSVEMGQPLVLADRPVVTAAPSFQATALAALRVPNPHVVVRVRAEQLGRLDLTAAPQVAPALPEGQNVEFVAVEAERTIRMRVHERGSGETRSCGTGICAAAIAVAAADGPGPDGVPWTVHVLGGTCTVTWSEAAVTLTGPAVLVAELEIDDAWWDGIAATP